MKEHFQDHGIRKWAGNDLIELQSEPMEALQKMVGPYAPCILQGCETTENEDGTITVEPGLVALQGKDYKGADCVKIARFAGIADEKPPLYLTLECETESRVYGDSQSKAIAYHYRAVATTQKPEVPYLEINASDNKRLVDTLGITQKLDREGGDASQTKVMFIKDNAGEHTNIQSGSALGTLFGKIERWFSDLKAHAFRAIAREDLADDLKKELDGKATGNHTHTPASLGAAEKSHSHTDATTTSAGFMSAADKKKMNLFSNHQQVFSSYAVRLASHGTYGFILVGDKWVSNNYGVNNGVAETTWKIISLSAQTVTFKYRVMSEYSYDKLTITVNGTVAVNEVSGQGNETAFSVALASGENTLVAKYTKDGSSNVYFDCAYIRFGSVESAATKSEQGLMSATDKTKLDGIATGANNYTHPTSAAGVKSSGLYKITTDANGHITAATAVTKADITALGIPAQDTDTVYTHPTTAGNKHVPSGGSSGQYLKYSSAGTAAWATPASNLATTSAAGFMSAADKKKLDGAYIYYMANVQCSDTGANPKDVYNLGNISATFIIKDDGYGTKCCAVSIPKPSGYTYVKFLILGQSNGAAWIASNSGVGSCVVYIMNHNSSNQILGSTFTLVAIAHN